jgi:tetrahydromethanopterin S-methyltransferase subunit G
MDKRTVASAHQRIDELEKQLVKHEAVSAERWKETILRIKRIEGVMIAATGGIIAMLVAILMKLT